MDKITFPMPGPNELECPRLSTTRASGGIVEMIVPVLVPGQPVREHEIRLSISLEHAQHMAGQLRAAIVTAKVQLRRR